MPTADAVGGGTPVRVWAEVLPGDLPAAARLPDPASPPSTTGRLAFRAAAETYYQRWSIVRPGV